MTEPTQVQVPEFVVTWRSLTSVVTEPTDPGTVALVGEVRFSALRADNRLSISAGHLVGLVPRGGRGIVGGDGIMRRRLTDGSTGEVGVPLWCADPEFGLEGLRYRVAFELYGPRGQTVQVDPGEFAAPATPGELNLAAVLIPSGSLMPADWIVDGGQL